MTLLNQKKAFTIIVLLLLSDSATALSTLPNITFYGRIIDQYSQPVIDASVWYEATSTYLSAGGGRGQVQTDEQGYFEIDSVGASLTIGTVTHPEISRISYSTPKYGENINRISLPPNVGAISFRSPKDNQGYPTWKDHTEKDKAYVVNAWRLSEFEGAKALSISESFDATGKFYTLLKNKNSSFMKRIDGKTEGLLHISCTRPHMEDGNDYGDWHVSIIPVDGGIQETDDKYMNLAPMDGYQASIEIVMKKSNSSYTHQVLNKRYYFNINNGNAYGSMFINLKPFWAGAEEDECDISIVMKLNSTGIRNLELRKDNSGG